VHLAVARAVATVAEEIRWRVTGATELGWCCLAPARQIDQRRADRIVSSVSDTSF
jgi:hypothetical protein